MFKNVLVGVDGTPNARDAIALASRGYGPVRRLVLGSTTDYLERHGRCSLLALPRGV